MLTSESSQQGKLLRRSNVFKGLWILVVVVDEKQLHNSTFNQSQKDGAEAHMFTVIDRHFLSLAAVELRTIGYPQRDKQTKTLSELLELALCLHSIALPFNLRHHKTHKSLRHTMQAKLTGTGDTLL